MKSEIKKVQIEEQIKMIVLNIMDVDVTISSGDYLMDDLGLDSLDFIELITQIEKEFDLEIQESVEDEIKTIKDIVGHIKNMDKHIKTIQA